MRSNDAIWGTPTDVAFFCSLQMQIHAHLKEIYPDLELGTYTHVANSYHVYDRHYDLAQRMLAAPFNSVKLPQISTDLIEIDGSPTDDFNIVFAGATGHTNDLVLFQQDNDLLKWIFEKLKEDTNVN
jgi:thymidylate synthase